MKRFLLTNPSNKKWLDVQEKRHKSMADSENVAKLVRREMFPQLHPESIAILRDEVNTGNASSPPSNIQKIMWMEANQRKLHGELMKELLARNPKTAGKGKVTASTYRTMSWEKRSRAIFFYLHESLGNRNMELTCSLFGINILTFKNWITGHKNPMYDKWIHYIELSTVSDILPFIPEAYRSKYEDVDPAGKVEIDSKFRKGASPDKRIVSAVSARSNGTRQMLKKIASKQSDVTYLLKTTKSVGSGRKVKYDEEEKFIIESVVMGWETGNPLSKGCAYNVLIAKFGHSAEDEQTEWEKVMDIHSGRITPNLSQWLNRVLKRHHFSVRKESISQTVPVNWIEICLAATKLICATMRNAGVTRLVNADEMFLQFYPKESQLIAPSNVKRFGSNRSEDEKKGCTVMVGCEMFTSQLIAPMVIMTGTPTGTLSRKFSDWDGCSKVRLSIHLQLDENGNKIGTHGRPFFLHDMMIAKW